MNTTANMGTVPTAIGQIAITVSNVQAALAFYRDTLGVPFLFAASDNLAFLQLGATRIMLTTPQGAGAVGANSVLYLRVTGIETAYAEYLSRGARSERPPAFVAKMPDHDLWIAFLRDPDGNLVGLMEEKAA
jgi:methylmalonyl-CoA/ethylmalonyl-CoA epimerase